MREKKSSHEIKKRIKKKIGIFAFCNCSTRKIEEEGGLDEGR
jgi:hypothetical protein